MKAKILDVILEITKNDEDHILFLLSEPQYESYTDDRQVLSGRVKKQHTNTDFNSWNTDREMHDQMRYVRNLFEDVSREDKRKVAVIFTKTRQEINDLAVSVINADDININVYII